MQKILGEATYIMTKRVCFASLEFSASLEIRTCTLPLPDLFQLVVH